MSYPRSAVVRRLVDFTVLLASLAGSPVLAQTARPPRDFHSGMRTGIGYSGVMPDAIIGAGVYRFVRGPVGLFGDVKATSLSGIRNKDTYCPAAIAQCTVAWVQGQRNDELVENRSEWLVLDVGIVYALTPEFALMVGGGMTRESRFREYFDDNEDPDQRVTDSGSYFVDDDTGPDWKAQAVGGLLLRAGRNVAFRVGYETGLGGLGFGGYIVLPW